MEKIILMVFVIFILVGFTTSTKVEALIKKEIQMVFNIEKYSKEPVTVSKGVNETLPIKITDTNFYKIVIDTHLIGYYYFGQAYGKADYFDFIVIFDSNLIVSKVKVLVYRENHGGEVGSTRWLKQFIGKTANEILKYQKDIAAISGATISAKSLTNEVNKLLKTVEILHTEKQL